MKNRKPEISCLTSKRMVNGWEVMERMGDNLNFTVEVTDDEVDKVEFKIIGQSGEIYNVTVSDDKWVCDCPDYEYRATCEESFLCKHIYAVLIFILP